MPTLEQLQRYASEFNKSLTLKHFSAEVSFPSLELVRVKMPEIKPEFRGGMGTDAVNGGVIAAIFDLVIGCTPALVDPTRRSATVQLSMSFMRPVSGTSLIAEAWIDVPGTSTLFSSGRLFDGTGRECARCQGIVKIAKISWASGDSPAIN